MCVSIKFETENEAFQDGKDGLDLWAVADKLEEIAGQIRDGETNGPIADYNGNSIGRYIVE